MDGLTEPARFVFNEGTGQYALCAGTMRAWVPMVMNDAVRALCATMEAMNAEMDRLEGIIEDAKAVAAAHDFQEQVKALGGG